MTESETLAKLLTSSWRSMLWVGDEVDGYTTVARVVGDNGKWTCPVDVITRAPSGQHYRWSYEQALTSRQDHVGPGEYGVPEVTPVRPEEKTTVETVWVPDGGEDA